MYITPTNTTLLTITLTYIIHSKVKNIFNTPIEKIYLSQLRMIFLKIPSLMPNIL